jgi:hypothetical protein
LRIFPSVVKPMALAQFSVTMVSFDSGAGKLPVAFLLQQRPSNPSLLYKSSPLAGNE